MKQFEIFIRRPIKALAPVFLIAALMLSFARASAAVTISALSAQAQTTTIVINWRTASELNNAGFNVYRGAASNGPFTKLNTSLVPVKNPGSISGASYSYIDSSAEKGKTHYYKLESVEFNGTTQQFGPVNAAISTPTATPTSIPPTATRTPTTVPPTATRTPTTAATVASIAGTTSAATVTSIPGTATPTVYNSPPAGTPPQTATPFPTRVALFVDPAAPTRSLPTSAPVRPSNPNAPPPAPPQPNEPVVVPTTASIAENPIQENPQPSSDEPTTNQPTETNSLLVALYLAGGVAVMMVIAVGAASFYLLAHKFIR